MMQAPLITDAQTVEEAIARHTGSGAKVVSRTPVSGGCIANGVRLETSAGTSYFLKQSATLPPEMFTAEAQGLHALQSSRGPRVPVPVAVYPGDATAGAEEPRSAGRHASGTRRAHGAGASEAFILMEWIDTGRAGDGFHKRFGKQLALMHRELTADRFGFARDNFIGSTPQPNSWRDSWGEFFADVRLRYQVRLAVDHGRVDGGTARQLESVIQRADHLLVEPAAPAVLHGDLWGGNDLCDSGGDPVLIDPAVYYGHPEADLAMTELFGGFRPAFYRAYRAASPLAPGYDERRDLYNLYHVLNHLNIFGGSYLEGVRRIAARYA